jgi:hypothetical protein
MNSEWLRFTVEKDALDYLEKAAYFIKETDKDIMAWKWVVLALSSALYGFAISTCRGTDYENVLKQNSKGAKEEKLIDFRSALKLCKKKNHPGMVAGSKPLKLYRSTQKFTSQ